MTMNKSEAELLDSVADKIARTVADGQRQHWEAHKVSKTIDNPLLWVSFLGVLFLVLGSLLLFVYQSSQEAQDNVALANKAAIESNMVDIKELKDGISDVLVVVKDIQNDQEKQNAAAQRLAGAVDKIVDKQNTILSSRFEDKDFGIHIKPYVDRLENVEEELERRNEVIKDVDNLKRQMLRIETKLEMRSE